MKKRLLSASLFVFLALGLMCLPVFAEAEVGTSMADEPDASYVADEVVNGAGLELEDAALSAGLYTIHAYKNTDVVMAVPAETAEDTAIVLEADTGARNQKFIVTPEGDGLYAIINYDTGLSLDIPGQSTEKRTPVHQHRSNRSTAQRFYVRKDADEGLLIIPSYVDLPFDVKGGEAVPGGSVQIYKLNGTEAQRFIFEEAEADPMRSGYYTIRSAANDRYVLAVANDSMDMRADMRAEKYSSVDSKRFVVSEASDGMIISAANSWYALDVRGGTMTEGTAIQQYKQNNSLAQKWQFLENEDGSYSIVSAKDTDYYVTVTEKAEGSSGISIQRKIEGRDAVYQKFYLQLLDAKRNMPSNSFTIASSENTALCLDVADGSKDNRANIQLYKSNGTNAQKFYLKYQGNGYYAIKNAKSEKVIDVAGGSTAKRTNIQQYKQNWSVAQNWRFVSLGGGNYRIMTALKDNMCLDIAHGDIVKRANIQLYTANDESNAQVFTMIPVKVVPEVEPYLIAIDAGHQGIVNTGTEPIGPGSTVMKRKVTTGTHGNWSGLDEAVLNLQVSQKLRTELEARGYKVYMIRDSQNVNISNAERARMATQAGADILVRIHANSSDNASVRGVMVYQPSSGNPYLNATVIAGSQKLSSLLLTHQCASTGLPNKGILTGDDMTGINWATMPVTIVEMGFMSNQADDLYMASAGGQAAIVQGLANGIEAYFK